MTGVLAHRGPDDQGTYCNDYLAVGMRRLSIIDLGGGHQPIWNEDSSCAVVCNGEIYNFLELRTELQGLGHRFRTSSDTEVILHAYEQWQSDCLRRFNGMFAFAVWDLRSRSLFLARDRVGEKPLYIYQDSQWLIFASEIKAILACPLVPRRINLRGLTNFLAFGHAVAPDTIYEGISKLLPGHWLRVHGGRTEVRRYWDVGDELQLEPGVRLNEEQWVERIRALLEDAVRRRMIADVPVGAFLSGGVDSTAVVALMKRHATDEIQTFSLGFTVGGAYNELADARRTARHLGTEHHELLVEHTDLVKLLHTLVYHYDEPFGDAAGFPVYLLSQYARQRVKVVLAGDGGDELFGGYRRYGADRLAAPYQLLPTFLTDCLAPRLAARLPRLRRLKRGLQTLPLQEPATRYARWLVLFDDELLAELLNPELWSELADYRPDWPYPLYYGSLSPRAAADHLNRLMYVDFKTWLPDVYLEKVDKATMACSLEARLPVLDHRLVELAFQIPGGFKIRHWKFKRIFKQAVRGLVPQEVLRRPKHGFAVPTDPWFRGELKAFAFEVLLDERARRRGYFRSSVVERLWREHSEGRQVWDTHLWLLLNFELWHRIFLDGDSP